MKTIHINVKDNTLSEVHEMIDFISAEGFVLKTVVSRGVDVASCKTTLVVNHKENIIYMDECSFNDSISFEEYKNLMYDNCF